MSDTEGRARRAEHRRNDPDQQPNNKSEERFRRVYTLSIRRPRKRYRRPSRRSQCWQELASLTSARRPGGAAVVPAREEEVPRSSKQAPSSYTASEIVMKLIAREGAADGCCRDEPRRPLVLITCGTSDRYRPVHRPGRPPRRRSRSARPNASRTRFGPPATRGCGRQAESLGLRRARKGRRDEGWAVYCEYPENDRCEFRRSRMRMR